MTTQISTPDALLDATVTLTMHAMVGRGLTLPEAVTYVLDHMRAEHPDLYSRVADACRTLTLEV